MPSTLTPVPSAGTALPLSPTEQKLLEAFRSMDLKFAEPWVTMGIDMAAKYPRREPPKLRLIVSEPPRSRARARRSK